MESDESIAEYVRRHDFSRWVHDVFRDYPLASHLRRLEDRAKVDQPRTIAKAIDQAIRARYGIVVDSMA